MRGRKRKKTDCCRREGTATVAASTAAASVAAKLYLVMKSDTDATSIMNQFEEESDQTNLPQLLKKWSIEHVFGT